MAIRVPDPVAAADAPEVEAADGDELDEDELEHPPISTAIAAIAIPHTAIRVCLSPDIGPYRSSPKRKPGEPIVEASCGSAEAERIADGRCDQDLFVAAV